MRPVIGEQSPVTRSNPKTTSQKHVYPSLDISKLPPENTLLTLTKNKNQKNSSSQNTLAKSAAFPAAVIFSLSLSMKVCAKVAKKPRRGAGAKAKACSKETTSGGDGAPPNAVVQR